MKQKDIDLYLDLAIRVSKQSYAKRLKVGAVFVTENGVISIGYNGTPSGWDNCCEDTVYVNSVLTGEELWDEQNQQYYKLVTKPEVTHAEKNLFSKLMRQGVSTKNGVMFLTHSPCFSCSQQIYEAGVKAIYYIDDYRSTDGIKFLRKVGINVEKCIQKQICDNKHAHK
jgi:dCMP deaminase